MNHNRVLNINDYPDTTRRKQWEIQAALDALDSNGAISRRGEILGVGAGTEATTFILSTKVRRVWATDLYAQPGEWSRTAPPRMLTDPGSCVPKDTEYELNRIVVQHMDMRSLRFPDQMFHGIYSSGSIEHLPSWEDIANTAQEMARVLRPGGILSLSTEWIIDGPSDQFDNVLLFDRDRLEKWIIKPSGLTPVDDLVEAITDDTMAHQSTLIDLVKGKRPKQEAVLISPYGHTFTSVHICLRKD